jgi:hypothetical protein
MTALIETIDTLNTPIQYMTAPIETIDTLNTPIHNVSLSWHDTVTSIKRDGAKLVLLAETFTLRDMMWSCKCFSYLLFFFTLYILEGPPTFGMIPDSVTIGYHTSVNSRVIDIQITDLGDFIKK